LHQALLRSLALSFNSKTQLTHTHFGARGQKPPHLFHMNVVVLLLINESGKGICY
jgi:hypothetical protein